MSEYILFSENETKDYKQISTFFNLQEFLSFIFCEHLDLDIHVHARLQYHLDPKTFFRHRKYLYCWIELKNTSKSSRPEAFCKKCFRKINWKTPVLGSLFLNKVVGLRPATLLKKRLWHKRFPLNFAKFLVTLFFTENHRWLLLHIRSTVSDFRRLLE